MDNKILRGFSVTVPEKKSEQMALIGYQMKGLRLSQGLTLEETAEYAGLDLESLKRFEETGEISLRSLLNLARVLECSLDLDQLFFSSSLPNELERLKKSERCFDKFLKWF